MNSELVRVNSFIKWLEDTSESITEEQIKSATRYLERMKMKQPTQAEVMRQARENDTRNTIKSFLSWLAKENIIRFEQPEKFIDRYIKERND